VIYEHYLHYGVYLLSGFFQAHHQQVTQTVSLLLWRYMKRKEFEMITESLNGHRYDREELLRNKWNHPKVRMIGGEICVDQMGKRYKIVGNDCCTFPGSVSFLNEGEITVERVVSRKEGSYFHRAVPLD